MSLRIPLHICVLVAALISFQSCSSSKRSAKAKDSSQREATYGLSEKYARALGVSPEEIKNERLYLFIEEWYSAPYQYGGLSKSGVDCSGFTHMLYKEVYDKDIPRRTGDLAAQAKKVPEKSLREGDLVFFDIEGKKTTHVGVYLQNRKFVHASTSKGVIISDMENPYYRKYFGHAGRL